VIDHLAVLTTETTHHAYFVREMAAHARNLTVFLEERRLEPPYKCSHPYEQYRERHEAERWFAGRKPAISTLAETRSFDRLNDPAAVRAVKGTMADVIIVFGTSRLKPAMIDAAGPRRILNLHGGDPETYRGLDTQIWAIWHRDYGGLVTTLHHLASELDAGDIVSQGSIQIHHNMRLHELRAANSEVCVNLARRAIEDFAVDGVFSGRPLRSMGRYYSFMPAVLKAVCVQRFERYTSQLP